MADQLELMCINHPKKTTRIRCSSCDSPICVKCMRQSSVGMKCPECASPPRRARMIGRPRHYLLGALAGLGTATATGALLISARVGYFGLIGSILIGFIVGSVVLRASSRLRHPAIAAIAAGSTAVGLAAGGLLAGLPQAAFWTGPFLLPLLIAAGSAAFFANR